MSHLDKTVNKNKNISINDSYKDTEKKRFHIIHENIVLTMLKKKRIRVNFDNTDRKAWIVDRCNNYK